MVAEEASRSHRLAAGAFDGSAFAGGAVADLGRRCRTGACQGAAHGGDAGPIGPVEIDDHVRERDSVLGQHRDARAAAPVLDAVFHLLAPTGADGHQCSGPKLDQAPAEHRIAHAAGHAAEQRRCQGVHVAGGRVFRHAVTQRVPAPQQRVVLGGQRRTLLPGREHFTALRGGGVLLRLRLLERLLVLLILLLLLRLLLLARVLLLLVVEALLLQALLVGRFGLLAPSARRAGQQEECRARPGQHEASHRKLLRRKGLGRANAFDRRIDYRLWPWNGFGRRPRRPAARSSTARGRRTLEYPLTIVNPLSDMDTP